MQINGRYLVNHGQTGNLGCAEPRGRESRLWELNLVNKYHPQSGLQFLGLRDALVTGRFLRRAWWTRVKSSFDLRRPKSRGGTQSGPVWVIQKHPFSGTQTRGVTTCKNQVIAKLTAKRILGTEELLWSRRQQSTPSR